MKMSRKNLKRVINEFLDTSRQAQATQDNATVYNQVSNSERAAFIAAMNVAAGAKNESLEEGTVTRFPSDRVRSSQIEDEGQDPVGPVYTIQPYGTDLEGDTASLEADDEDMTAREIAMLRNAMRKRKEITQSARASDVYDIEDEIADMADAYSLGNLTDLFADED
jgi:hypothetical protein